MVRSRSCDCRVSISVQPEDAIKYHYRTVFIDIHQPPPMIRYLTTYLALLPTFCSSTALCLMHFTHHCRPILRLIPNTAYHYYSPLLTFKMLSLIIICHLIPTTLYYDYRVPGLVEPSTAYVAAIIHCYCVRRATFSYESFMLQLLPRTMVAEGLRLGTGPWMLHSPTIASSRNRCQATTLNLIDTNGLSTLYAITYETSAAERFL